MKQATLGLVATGICCVSLTANGISIRDEVGNAGALSLGDPFTGVALWTAPWMQNPVGCSGFLVTRQALLTARHCFDTNRQVDASLLDVLFRDDNTGGFDAQIKVNSYSLLNPSSLDFLDGTDLALLFLAEEAPAWATPFWFADTNSSYFERDRVTMVGFGIWGLGSTGATNPQNGLRRAAENVIDKYGPAVDWPFNDGKCQDYQANTNNILSADFDRARPATNSLVDCGSSAVPVSYEGMIVSGDSGGPLLFDYKGQWLVAGVASGFGGTQTQGRYGELSWWTATGLHLGWIENEVQDELRIWRLPEPGSLALLGLGLAGLGLSGRRKAT